MPTTLPNGLVIPDPGAPPSVWRPTMDDNITALDTLKGTVEAFGDSVSRDVGTTSGDVAAGNAPGAAITAHVAATHPHTQYLRESDADAIYARMEDVIAVAGVRGVPVAPLPASESNGIYPLVRDFTLNAVWAYVQPGTINDEDNYWALHIATADVELLVTTTASLSAGEWSLIEETTFTRPNITIADDAMIAYWFEAVGTPDEMQCVPPIFALL